MRVVFLAIELGLAAFAVLLLVIAIQVATVAAWVGMSTVAWVFGVPVTVPVTVAWLFGCAVVWLAIRSRR